MNTVLEQQELHDAYDFLLRGMRHKLRFAEKAGRAEDIFQLKTFIFYLEEKGCHDLENDFDVDQLEAIRQDFLVRLEEALSCG